MVEKKVENKIVKEMEEILTKEGIDILEFREGRKLMNEAIKKLDRRLQNARNRRKYLQSTEPHCKWRA